MTPAERMEEILGAEELVALAYSSYQVALNTPAPAGAFNDRLAEAARTLRHYTDRLYQLLMPQASEVF
jgi:hypothetical protein